ncbi:MAG: phenylalanine--tRNA ligase subunit alpha [Bacilli bacterium]|nr:phenylalanine--tRNA ligase subunit alpha [Bacilli bacterium]
MAELHEIAKQALTEIENAKSLRELNDVRIKYLGKKGPIQEAMKIMKDLDEEGRKAFGKLANDTKNAITEALEAKERVLQEEELKRKLEAEKIDVTLPSRKQTLGIAHLTQQVIMEIEDIFLGMGYTIAEGPEVESDYFNFEMLNLPKGHPARDMQDSFYITEELLLRTHTSPVQARTMLKYQGQGPVKIICPGKVYRRDDDDATHSHQFLQIEGLVIDEKITMSDLKGTLAYFAKKMFGEEREIRFRPSFFPFTEPSVEVDVTCAKCLGKGCPMCKHTGYIEILGAGMVHPNVLRMGGFDPEKYQGFAFGMGPERIAILKYGIDDIRQFYTNDLRFNHQFNRML